MEELREIAGVITSDRLRVRKTVLDEKSDSLLRRLYEGIVSGSYVDDNEAAKNLYGTDQSDPRYKTLKARLKDRMLTTVRLLDSPQSTVSTYREAINRTRQDLNVINILLMIGARVPAMRLLRQVLNIAEKFCVTDVEVQSYKLLREDAALRGHFKQYDLMNSHLQQATERLRLERRAEEIDDRLVMEFINSRAHKPQLRDQAGAYIAEIEDLRTICDTPTINLLYFRIKTTAHQARFEYQETLQTCAEAERYYSNHPEFSSKNTLAGIAIARMGCCLQLRDYEAGKRSAQQCIEMFPDGNTNWFSAHTSYFIIAVHSGDYFLAIEIFQRITEHPRFSMAMRGGRAEIWKIFEGYLNFIVQCGWTDLPETETEGLSKRFRLNKFLNEFTLVSQDKQGMNVAVQILQVIWLLETESYMELINLQNSIRAYIARHLRRKEFLRANRFMKLILVMIDSDFDSEQMRRKGERYHHDLRNPHDTQVSISVDGVEVIPYEKLWEWMLNRTAQRRIG